MTPEEHKARHVLLHKHLDELFADWITHEPSASFSCPLIDLINWSHGQTRQPTESAQARKDSSTQSQQDQEES